MTRSRILGSLARAVAAAALGVASTSAGTLVTAYKHSTLAPWEKFSNIATVRP